MASQKERTGADQAELAQDLKVMEKSFACTYVKERDLVMYGHSCSVVDQSLRQFIAKSTKNGEDSSRSSLLRSYKQACAGSYEDAKVDAIIVNSAQLRTRLETLHSDLRTLCQVLKNLSVSLAREKTAHLAVQDHKVRSRFLRDD